MTPRGETWGQATDAVVLSVPVVEVIPDGQGRSTFVGVLICAAVGPFAQGRLDEAFGLAVGLRPIGTGELLRNAQSQASLAEGGGVERRAVVHNEPLDRHAQPDEVARGCTQEATALSFFSSGCI